MLLNVNDTPLRTSDAGPEAPREPCDLPPHPAAVKRLEVFGSVLPPPMVVIGNGLFCRVGTSKKRRKR